MSYEYLYPHVDVLRDKPLSSEHLMKLVSEAGLRPLAVRVDNSTGQVFFYFEKPLGRKEKERLDELVEKLFKEWK
ncbi:MAG: hypothetical protein QW512_05235 [Thermofilaceae archaeon]